MEKAYQRLRNRWGPTYASEVGTPSAEVIALEQRYDLRLPPDFRDYLLFAAPRVDAGMDDEGIDWWPVSRIKNVPDEYEHPVAGWLQTDAAGYLFFADLLVWCWAWAICCRGSDYGKVAVLGVGVARERFVTENFSDFIELYLTDAQTLASDATPLNSTWRRPFDP
jgi:hypothetical protein